jgi:hypothetical protein
MIDAIFTIGPSGVGKSHISELLTKQQQCLFMDIDIHHPFGHYGLRKEWNSFERKLDPLPLASTLLDRINAANAARVLFSFPSRRVLTRKHIDAARTVGIRTILLWGSRDYCKKQRLDVPTGGLPAARVTMTLTNWLLTPMVVRNSMQFVLKCFAPMALAGRTNICWLASLR